MNRTWLPVIWVAVVLASLEAWTLALVVGNVGQLCDLGAMTFGTILFGVGVDEVNRDQRRELRALAVRGLAIAFLLFLVLTWIVAKRAEGENGVWILGEFGMLLVLAIPTFGLTRYLDATRRLSHGS